MKPPHYQVIHLSSMVIDKNRIGPIVRTQLDPDHLYNQPVHTLPFLTIRTFNRLRFDGIKTIGALLGTPYNYIQTTRNIGQPTAEKLMANLVQWGVENNLPVSSSRLIKSYNGINEWSQIKKYVLPRNVRLNQPIVRGGFISKLTRILPMRGYRTIGDVLNEKESTFKTIRSIGKTSAKSIRPALTKWCAINRLDPNDFTFFN